MKRKGKDHDGAHGKKASICVLMVLLLSFLRFTACAEGSYCIRGTVITLKSAPAGGNGDCWGYANEIYYQLWGRQFSNSFSDSRNMLRDLSDAQRAITAENTRRFIGDAPLGAVIRIANAPSADSTFDDDHASYSGHDYYLDSGQLKCAHSMVLVDKTEQGFTIFHSSGGSAEERSFTWESFSEVYSGKYVYFKYICWEGE